MNQNNEELEAPRPGQPPSYQPSVPPQIMRPTNQKYVDGQPTIIPRGEPILDSNGQPIQIQYGTIMEPRANNHHNHHNHYNPPIIPVVVGHQMGPKPGRATCPYCHEVIVTRIESKANVKTHIFAVMFGILCLWPCVLIPYFTDSFRNTDHYCPNCNAYMGSYVR